MAETYTGLAASNYYRGRYRAALDFFGQALQICLQLHGEENLRTAMYRNNFGLAQLRLGGF